MAFYAPLRRLTLMDLEHLGLTEFLQQFSGGETFRPPRSLPSILSLRVYGHTPIHSTQFLSRITIPTSSARLFVGAKYDEGQRGETIGTSLPPNLVNTLPNVATFTWARLTLVLDWWTPDPILARSDWEERMSDSLDDLLTVFGDARLTHLEVIGLCATVTAETWITVFQAFPCLVSLEADAEAALFDGLHAASLASLAPSDNTDSQALQAPFECSSSESDITGHDDEPHVPAPPPLNGLRQDIQRRLDMLDVKEEEIRRQRLELKSAWNHSLAVTQLPNEILFHIFVAVGKQPVPPSKAERLDTGHLQVDSHLNGQKSTLLAWTMLITLNTSLEPSIEAEILLYLVYHLQVPPSVCIPIKFGQAHGDSDGDENDSSEFRLARTGWTKLMLVCHRCHDVAHATPALWRTIDVGKTTSWMKLALTRSCSATLDVSFPFHFSEEHASLLKLHCHRLRSLRLRSWSPFALRLIRNALPTLETLEIHNNPDGMKDARKGFYTDLRLSRTQLPNLHTLQLVYSLIPRDPLFYARLRKLSLKACPFKATVEQFVRLLASNPCLEHLELDEFLQHLSDSGEVRRAWPLPSLHSLHLSNHIPLHSAQFLSRLLIPQTPTSLAIEGLAEEMGDNPYTLRALVPPKASSSLPGLSTVAWARLVVTWKEIAIKCPSMESDLEEESDPALLVDLALTSSSPTAGLGWADSMPDGLTDLITLFGAAPLTRLELIGDCFAVAEEHDHGLPVVACRGLERIIISDYWGASRRVEWFLDPLIRCLRYRAERGSRLQELHLAARRPEDMVDVYLPQLEELVPNLELRYTQAFT
ncbi:hypothetical protein GSI_13168 [Ganoderma sinense ZZ0214-1]|uniref:Uncharacterized protein n=1 Tax=Ganoderma sinense ZZ0214-1 TaxID=1077348 RepID=A0A2G8RUV8_9APHY|nr:hypothetical protein GSI_13168 [Ganoderma sinense ZZ0214-1]